MSLALLFASLVCHSRHPCALRKSASPLQQPEAVWSVVLLHFSSAALTQNDINRCTVPLTSPLCLPKAAQSIGWVLFLQRAVTQSRADRTSETSRLGSPQHSALWTVLARSFLIMSALRRR